MTEPVEWRNKRGISKWQPAASDGSRMWLSYWDDNSSGVWKFGELENPFLVSRRKAIQLARFEERRMDREENDEVWEEVPHD